MTVPRKSFMMARKKVARRAEAKEVEEVKERNGNKTNHGVGQDEFLKRKRESEARGFERKREG